MTASEGKDDLSRRSFLAQGTGLFTSMWVAAQWPGIAAAAHHADEAANSPAPVGFTFFSAADAADVEAICARIVPSGATPGAREAHAIYFIDRTLSTYFAASAPDFSKGLADFQGKFHAAQPQIATFAAANPDAQIAFLKTVDQTPFFETTRMLTILGMFTSPKYSGNYQGAGWKLMGFVDQHAFVPPFGYYDRDYAGFVPYGAGATS
jgi:gluconate 2-dehydrogenase gamma chain